MPLDKLPDQASRRPTMKDIAAEAGVSKGLVSLILSGTPGPSADTAARVVMIAERLGYRANRAASLLARRRSRLLGVTATPSSPFHGEVVEAIQHAADMRDYEIALGPVTATHDERRALEALLDLRCEAVLLVGSDMSPDLLRTVVSGIPVVSVGRPVELPQVDVVRADDRAGIGLAVDHLAGLGHRRIGHVDGGGAFISAERREGYTSRMRRHRLPTRMVAGGHTERDGFDACRRLFDEFPDTTAVISYNDRCAVGVLEFLDRAGLAVPQQVSVTGFDNSTLAQLLRIDLTTVSQEANEQAELAVAAIIERLDGGRTTRIERVLAPQLMIRSTTAPPP